MLCYLTTTPHQSFSWPIIYQTHMKISRNSFFSLQQLLPHTHFHMKIWKYATNSENNLLFLKGSLTHNHAQCDLPNLPFKKVYLKQYFPSPLPPPPRVARRRRKGKMWNKMEGEWWYGEWGVYESFVENLWFCYF